MKITHYYSHIYMVKPYFAKLKLYSVSMPDLVSFSLYSCRP